MSGGWLLSFLARSGLSVGVKVCGVWKEERGTQQGR